MDVDTGFVTPSLDEQKQFFATTNDDEVLGIAPTENLEHASLVSPVLENSGYSMPSQFALLGELRLPYNPEYAMSDGRVMLNTNSPFAAFVCGVQGSGKSHTTACMIGKSPLSLVTMLRLQKTVPFRCQLWVT